MTQTFGAGVAYNDTRVFAEFARCVIEKRDIVLKTKGETRRNYVSVNDAAEAIFTILLDGGVGEAYNVANSETYCSIYEMADMVAKEFGNNFTRVKICEVADVGKFGYAPTLKMNLDCTKLNNLGWRAQDDLKHIFAEMIAYMQNSML